ncbi:MAG TPA: hypothetical protein VGM94_10390 [Galbitalea sp.]|jgi:hypothetical protein
MRTAAPRLRLWAPALVVYAISRIYSTALLLVAYGLGRDHTFAFGSPRGPRSFLSFLDFLSAWDGTYYRSIALHGYPSELPHFADGSVEPNQWAFLPLFPLLARGLTTATTLNVDAAGILLSIVCGALATVVLARLVAPRVGERAATWTAAFFAFGPAAFVLQLPYAESLFCLLIFGCLVAMVTRRYLLVAVLGVFAAFTRPGELAISLALGILFLIRLRDRDTFPVAERARMLAAGVVTGLAGLAWPVIAGIVTGVPNAYVETELSWWTGFVGHAAFVPFTPWFLLAGRWLGILGLIAVIVVLAFAGWLMWRRTVREFEPAIRWFSFSYLIYLVGVLLPQQSVVRMLMPLSPILGVPWISTSRARRRALLTICIVLQPVSVLLLWLVGYP